MHVYMYIYIYNTHNIHMYLYMINNHVLHRVRCRTCEGNLLAGPIATLRKQDTHFHELGTSLRGWRNTVWNLVGICWLPKSLSPASCYWYTVGFHNFNLRIFNLRVSNPSKLTVDVLLTRCRISMCQGLGPKKHYKISGIDRMRGKQSSTLDRRSWRACPGWWRTRRACPIHV